MFTAWLRAALGYDRKKGVVKPSAHDYEEDKTQEVVAGTGFENQKERVSENYSNRAHRKRGQLKSKPTAAEEKAEGSIAVELKPS